MHPISYSFQMPKGKLTPFKLAVLFAHEGTSGLERLAIRKLAAETSPKFFKQFENAVKFLANLLRQNLKWN